MIAQGRMAFLDRPCRRIFGSDIEIASDSHALMRAFVRALKMVRGGWEAGAMDGVERSLIATAATGFLVMLAAIILLMLG
jgi:hypothetical protein